MTKCILANYFSDQFSCAAIHLACRLLQTRGCLGKTIITSIVSIEHIAHTLVVSPGTASGCDNLYHKSFAQIMTIV